MGPMNLYFDFRDIFRAPRLALSGKKIWVMLMANIPGYLIYSILAYLSLITAGVSFGDAWSSYGIYPCLMGNEANWIAYVIWSIGLLVWLVALLLGATAVARITYKQLKGDEFYSSSDAWKFVKKHWHAPVFTHLSILIIALFFVVMAIIFALIGKIPGFGELFFGIPYLLWFFGSVFVVYTLVVLVISLFFTHAIVATLEEDTMGAVFQNYSLTWSQPWRILLYIPLLFSLIYVGFVVFGWFMTSGYELVNVVFGWLMGSKLTNMVGWATSIIIGPCPFLHLYSGFFAGTGVCSIIPEPAVSLGIFEYIGGFFVALSLFLVLATLLSYALSIEVVGETIAIVIFKKKGDDENLLERKDEEELEAEEEEETEWSSEETETVLDKGDKNRTESDNDEKSEGQNEGGKNNE